MSKNHPHDNIYSILGKLAALQPTPQEKHDANVQQIRESVEAQGSIIKGLREISSTESRLAQQFAESKIEEKAINKYAVGMAAAKEKYGYGKEPAHNLPKKVIKKGHEIAKKVDEVAADMPPQVPGVAPQAQVSQAQFQTQKPQAPQAISNTKYGVPATASGKTPVIKDVSNSKGKLWALRTGDGQDNLVWIYGTKPDPACTEPVKAVFNGKPVTVMKMPGTHPDHESRGYIVTNTSSIQEATCNECGMYESKCSCDHTNEGKVTHPEKGVTRHTKTDFPGYPSDDLEKDDDDKDAPKSKGGKGRPRKATTKNPRRDPDAPKKSRGRPSKHSTGEKSSSDSLPFSSKNKVGHDLFGRVKSSAHKTVTEGLNLMRMQEEQHMTLDEMISCMQEDMLQFKKTGVCSECLRDMMEVYAHAKKQMEETVDRIAQPQASGIPKPNEFDITAPKAPSTNGIGGKYPPVTKPGQAVNDLTNPFKRTYEEEVDPMEAELNELAELAGLSEVSRGEYIKQQDANAEHSGKNKFNAFGQLFHTDEVDEELEQEGTLFTKGLEDDDVKIGDKIPGTNAIKTKDIDEDKIEVKDAPDAANKPKKKYFSMRASTMNPGEGDSGEKRMYPAHPAGDNGMTEPARKTPVKEDVLSLEAQLAAEYESIKKAS